MKTIAMCPVCLENAGRQAPGIEGARPVSGEIDDIGYIHVNCDLGHYGIVINNARRYEVLIKSAARAYVDGYTNEVIAVMSAALERCYEFYVRVSCRAKGIAPNTADHAWRLIAAQSERQFGAFHILFLIDQLRPFVLDPSIPATRNGVIHKGRIAREAEATAFAEKTYAVIREVESILEAKFSQEAKLEAEAEVTFQRSHIPEGVPHVTMSVATVRVSKQESRVVGKADCFLDHAAAVLQSRSQGWPE